ncbi:hypothetical protein VAA96_004542 [Salmonella enterica]|nr:hypothetical protein [Salmonella enterica]
MNEQNMINPLAPELSPTADQMLASFLNDAAAIRGEQPKELPQSFNPYQATEDTDNQSTQKHISNMETWLAPVKMDSFDITQAYDADKHDNFLKNLEEDPAQKEFGPQLVAFGDALRQEVANGMPPEQAQQLSQDFIQNHIKPIIDKHHKKGSTEGALHRKREPEIPELIKKIKGGK